MEQSNRSIIHRASKNDSKKAQQRRNNIMHR
jgi:hypothetical protein